MTQLSSPGCSPPPIGFAPRPRASATERRRAVDYGKLDGNGAATDAYPTSTMRWPTGYTRPPISLKTEVEGSHASPPAMHTPIRTPRPRPAAHSGSRRLDGKTQEGARLMDPDTALERMGLVNLGGNPCEIQATAALWLDFADLLPRHSEEIANLSDMSPASWSGPDPDSYQSARISYGPDRFRSEEGRRGGSQQSAEAETTNW